MDETYAVWLKDPKTGEDILWNKNSVENGVGKFTSKLEGVETIKDIIDSSAVKFSNNNAVGTRTLIKREVEGNYEKLTLGQYEWMNYGEWGNRIKNFGRGLAEKSGIHSGERLMIYAHTQADWMTAAFAGWSNNYVIVTAYATLGAEGATHAINATKPPVIVADAKLLDVLLEIQPACPSIKTIITIKETSGDVKEKLGATGINILTFDEVLDAGNISTAEPTAPKGEDTALIMFTSGTTGVPKGVVISHQNVIASVAGLIPTIKECGITSEDTYCAYLPLAHILEIIAEINMVVIGACMGYGTPHTLTDTGVKLQTGCHGDLITLKPTFVVFAPLVLEKIYNSVLVKAEALSGIKKWMFNWGLQSGIANFEKGYIGSSWIYDQLVFKKVQAMVGGRLKFVVTGSAPLAGDVHKFIQTALHVPVRQGYGLTETCAASVVQRYTDNHVSICGPPLESTCVKLLDWGQYKNSDKDNRDIGMARGEICVGGPTIATGYLVDPEDPDPKIVAKNKEEFVDANGMRWFLTGDIGAVLPNGTIKIVDRKKDLVKLQQGEYVALSKVEGVAKLSNLVENALCHVDPNQSFCTILVCPMLVSLKHWGEDHGFGDDLETLSQREELRKEILGQISDHAKGKLAKFEIPTKVYVVPPSKTWSPENGLLTAAMKLKRKPTEKAFQKEIQSMYQ